MLHHMDASDPMNVTQVLVPLKARSDRTSGAEIRAILPGLADKCVAHNRNGEPCGKDPMLGQSVCYFHGGSSPQAKAKASERVLEAVDMAQDLFMQRLIERLASPEAELIDTKVLLDGAERMTKLRELLEGRATERKDSTVTRSDEAWEILETRLVRLGEKRRKAAAIEAAPDA